MKIRKLLSREKIFEALKRLTVVRFRISHSSLLLASLLLLILFLAFTVRLLPIRWGLYLSEFDPYHQYRVAKHAVEKGLLSWGTGWSEVDPLRDLMSWYPIGRKISNTYPGLPLTAASSYLVARALGFPLSVFELCVIFPVIMGTLTCLAIYVCTFPSAKLGPHQSHITRLLRRRNGRNLWHSIFLLLLSKIH
jgi:asparagine N-glycosylation enzyme membrane subunit Stt3